MLWLWNFRGRISLEILFIFGEFSRYSPSNSSDCGAGVVVFFTGDFLVVLPLIMGLRRIEKYFGKKRLETVNLRDLFNGHLIMRMTLLESFFPISEHLDLAGK
jgi:hypothetical protein